MSVFRTITYFYVAQVMMFILVDVALNEPNAVLLLVWGHSNENTLVSTWEPQLFGQFATGHLLS